MSLDELSHRKKARYIAIALVAVVLLILLLCRIFVLPRVDPDINSDLMPILAKFLEDAFVALLVTSLIAVGFWFLIPKRVRDSEIKIIERRELKGHFVRALSSTGVWLFFGGCGRYFRSEVLEKMAERSKSESVTLRVSAIILNPADNDLCKAHGTYRSGTRRGVNEGGWAADKVKKELITTILCALETKINNPLLDVEVFLSNHFRGFRTDISDSCTITTREDPSVPALICHSGDHFYKVFREEFEIVKKQSSRLDFSSVDISDFSDLDQVKKVLVQLGLSGHGLSDKQIAEVLEEVGNRRNPYE